MRLFLKSEIYFSKMVKLHIWTLIGLGLVNCDLIGFNRLRNNVGSHIRHRPGQIQTRKLNLLANYSFLNTIITDEKMTNAEKEQFLQLLSIKSKNGPKKHRQERRRQHFRRHYFDRKY